MYVLYIIALCPSGGWHHQAILGIYGGGYEEEGRSTHGEGSTGSPNIIPSNTSKIKKKKVAVYNNYTTTTRS